MGKTTSGPIPVPVPVPVLGRRGEAECLRARQVYIRDGGKPDLRKFWQDRCTLLPDVPGTDDGDVHGRGTTY